MMSDAIEVVKILFFMFITLTLSPIIYLGLRLIITKPIQNIDIKYLMSKVYKHYRRYSVCISGIDGAGKTTLSAFLSKALEIYGIKSAVNWMRWPAFFAYIAIALGRLLGLNIYIYASGKRIRVVHSYKRIPCLANIYALLMLIDFLLKFYLIRIFRRQFLLLDRCLFDIFIDILYENGIKKLSPIIIGLYMRLLHKLFTRIILICVNPSTAYNRLKIKDVTLKELYVKHELYSLICNNVSKCTKHEISSNNITREVLDLINKLF